MEELIREMIWKYLPHEWLDEGTRDIIGEIYFRIEGLEEPEKHIKACIDYMLDRGNGDPIGYDWFVNETDDCMIWDYME